MAERFSSGSRIEAHRAQTAAIDLASAEFATSGGRVSDGTVNLISGSDAVANRIAQQQANSPEAKQQAEIRKIKETLRAVEGMCAKAASIGHPNTELLENAARLRAQLASLSASK